MKKVPTAVKSILWLMMFAALPFCLSAKAKSSVELGQIDEPSRIAFASHTLGHKRFHDLAAVKPGDLEKFIYRKVIRNMRNVPGADPQLITNTIISESNDAGVDPLFVLSVIQHESRFRNATVGTHGEIGLMQVMPATADWLSQEFGIIYHDKSELFDPVTNVRMGVNYIAWLHQKFPRTKDLAAAYNMGPKNLRRALSEKRRPKIYYAKVLKHYIHIYSEAQFAAADASISKNVIAENGGNRLVAE